MPAKDIYHNTVKFALQKDGWTITHDPFPLQIGKKRLSADLGAERLISAEKETQRIVVEVKSFVGQSDVKDLEQALGQYVLYSASGYYAIQFFSLPSPIKAFRFEDVPHSCR
ncbi:MAG: element excision factor XisH family protein, partial [Nostoc sp.]